MFFWKYFTDNLDPLAMATDCHGRTLPNNLIGWIPLSPVETMPTVY